MGEYEFWLTNDSGSARTLLNPSESLGIAFFDYVRTTRGIAYSHFGMSQNNWETLWPAGFSPDLILEIWRSPGVEGFTQKKLEGKFFIRKQRPYVRESDSMEMIEFWGRNGIDLLNRRFVIQPAGTPFTTKTDEIDDMMKDIVRQQMLSGYAVDEDGIVDTERMWPQGEFSVEDESSLGPIISQAFADENVLEILKELSDISFQKHKENSSDRKIYFDVVDGAALNWNEIFILEEDAAFSPILDESGDELLDEESLSSTQEKNVQFIFRTYADLRGQDRTGGTVFSIANGNLADPSHIVDHLDEITTVIVRGQSSGSNRVTAVVQSEEAVLASRWNRVEGTENASNQVSEDDLEEVGRASLWDNKVQDILKVTFLDSPGSESQPRSLYGIDWDLGDLLPVNHMGNSYEAEVAIIYISKNEDGEENITGRNIVE